MINLYIDQRRSAEITILDLKGRLRVGGNTIALHRSINTLLMEKKRLIVLNLAGVSFIDSSGLGELIASQISVENKGGSLKLAELTDSLKELLSTTKLLNVFDVYDREADAIQSLDGALAETTNAPLAFA